MSQQTTAKGTGPRAVGRVLELLDLLSRKRSGLSLTELSNATSIAKSTLLDTLRGLCELQYVSHVDGRYRLGSTAYRLGSQLMANWSAPEMIRLQVNELAERTGESVGFAIADWDSGQAFYTEAVTGSQPVRYAMHAGQRAPLYASAAGRVLLAYASQDRLEAYLARARLKPLTPATRTDAASIKQNLEQVRRDGYCASFGEMLRDTAAIAVPVHDLDSRMIGALILASPLDRMKLHQADFLAAIRYAGRTASAGFDAAKVKGAITASTLHPEASEVRSLAVAEPGQA